MPCFGQVLRVILLRVALVAEVFPFGWFLMGVGFGGLLPAQMAQGSWAAFEKRLKARDTLYVVNFWSTWCRPCIAELPYFQKAADSLRGRYPVAFYLVSLDFPPDGGLRAHHLLRQKNINLPAFWLTETNPNQWIPRVDNNWDGSLPFTLLWPAQKTRIGGFESTEEIIHFVLEAYETPAHR